MLSKDDRSLLNKVLDALDRLFDRELPAVDLAKFLCASGKAAATSEHRRMFDSTATELGSVAWADFPEDQGRQIALNLTNALRHQIAEELKLDAAENPKRRHL